MSEKEINTQDNDDFLKKAALRAGAVSGILLAGAGAFAIGQNAQREQNQEIIQETHNTEQASLDTYNNSIEAAINATYDSQQVIGEIDVTQGSNLIDPALEIVETNLGNDYEAAAARTYEPLVDSAKAQNPQPGETYSVVLTDINPEAKDGNEAIVVGQDQIRSVETATIPSPVYGDTTKYHYETANLADHDNNPQTPEKYVIGAPQLDPTPSVQVKVYDGPINEPQIPENDIIGPVFPNSDSSQSGE